MTSWLTWRSFSQQQSELCKWTPNISLWSGEQKLIMSCKHQSSDSGVSGAAGSSLPDRNSAGLAAGSGAGPRPRGGYCCRWFTRGLSRQQGGSDFVLRTGGILPRLKRNDGKHHRGRGERKFWWSQGKRGPEISLFKLDRSGTCSIGASQTHTDRPSLRPHSAGNTLHRDELLQKASDWTWFGLHGLPAPLLLPAGQGACEKNVSAV